MKIDLMKRRKAGRSRSAARNAGEVPSDASEYPQSAGRKRRRLKYITVLPSFITLMNGACGFLSIILASRSGEFTWNLLFIRRSYMTSFALAGYMIFFAMIADMLDGRVARLTRTTSSFGGQLDSLSDAISFGIAPAFLMVKLVEFHLERLRPEFAGFAAYFERGVLFSAILYAMCATVRLARFNVENEEDEAAHMNFAGLPSPAAAGVVVSLVIFQQQFMPRIAGEATRVYRVFEMLTVFALPLVTLLSGILMVSRIRYPHLANQLLRGKKTPRSLLVFFAAGIFIIWNIQLAMALGFCGFAIFGFARWVIARCRAKAPSRQAAED